MKLLVLLLMSLYAASAWSQDFNFVCGFSQIAESDSSCSPFIGRV